MTEVIDSSSYFDSILSQYTLKWAAPSRTKSVECASLLRVALKRIKVRRVRTSEPLWLGLVNLKASFFSSSSSLYIFIYINKYFSLFPQVQKEWRSGGFKEQYWPHDDEKSWRHALVRPRFLGCFYTHTHKQDDEGEVAFIRPISVIAPW